MFIFIFVSIAWTAWGSKQVSEEAQTVASRMVGPHYYEEEEQLLQRLPLVDRIEGTDSRHWFRPANLGAFATPPMRAPRTNFPLLFPPSLLALRHFYITMN